jgi:hypothetical protein
MVGSHRSGKKEWIVGVPSPQAVEEISLLVFGLGKEKSVGIPDRYRIEAASR